MRRQPKRRSLGSRRGPRRQPSLEKPSSRACLLATAEAVGCLPAARAVESSPGSALHGARQQAPLEGNLHEQSRQTTEGLGSPHQEKRRRQEADGFPQENPGTQNQDPERNA